MRKRIRHEIEHERRKIVWDERIFNSIPLFFVTTPLNPLSTSLHSHLSSPSFLITKCIFTLESIILSQSVSVCFMFFNFFIRPPPSSQSFESICFFHSFTLVDFSLLASFFRLPTLLFSLASLCEEACWFKKFFIVLFSRELNTGKNKQNKKILPKKKKGSRANAREGSNVKLKKINLRKILDACLCF